MANFCGIISDNKEPSPVTTLNFNELELLTEWWANEALEHEKVWSNQVSDVNNKDLDIMNNVQKLAYNSSMLKNVFDKLEMIEKELNKWMIELHLLEICVKDMEEKVAEPNPCNVDTQRFPMYQTLLQIIMKLNDQQEIIDEYITECRDYSREYKENCSSTCTLNDYVDNLEKLKCNFNLMENLYECNRCAINKKDIYSQMYN